MNGHRECVALLLDKNADCNIKDNENKTPLIHAATRGNKPILDALLTKAGQAGFNELMIESGATLLGQCFKRNLIDELVAFVAPKILGDKARPLATLDITDLADSRNFRIEEVKQVGDDIMLRCLRV